METCFKKQGQHRKRNRDKIEYGPFKGMQRSVWQKWDMYGSAGMELVREQGQIMHHTLHVKGEPLKANGFNIAESGGQQPEKTYSLSVVIFG